MPVRIPVLDAIQSGGQVSQLDPSSALGVNRAVSNAAGVAGEALHSGLDMIEEFQKVKNDGRLSDLKAQAKQAAMEYEAGLATNKDPSSWVPGFNKHMESYSSSVGLESMPPDVRAAYSGWSKEFQSTQSLKLSRDARIFSIEQAQVAKNNSIQRSIDMGDFGAAKNEVSTDSLLSPAEKEAGIYKIEQKEAAYNLDNDLNTDPRETLKELQSEDWLKTTPGATTQLRQWGIQKAEGLIQKRQKESMSGVVSDIEIGNIVTEDQLKERLATSKDIDPEMHDEMLFHFRQSQPLDADTKFAMADGLNGLYEAYKNGEITMDEYRTAHDGLSQVIYSFGTRNGAGELRQKMGSLDPTNWGPAKVPKDTRAQAVEAIGKTFLDSGAFGSISDEDKAKMSPFDIATKQTEIYNARKATDDAVKNWLLSPEGKDATQEQISDKYKSMFLDKAAAKILRPGGAWATQPEVEDYINGLSNPNDPKGASSSINTEPVGGNLTSMVKHFEAGGEKAGFHAKAYWDYGQWSIGYGTRAKQGEVIDREEAERRLQSELSVHKKRVLDANQRFNLDLAPHQIDALTSFDYNTGKLETLIDSGTRDKDTIASKMLLYVNAKGRFLPGLLNRRKLESYLFRNGYKGERREAANNPVIEPETTNAPFPEKNTGEYSQYNVILDG